MQETRFDQYVDAATALAAASAAGAKGLGRVGDLFLFVASEMTRVRRWKRTQVSKLLEKDGQRHQSCHLIYKKWRNRYDVRGGRLRDYGGGAPARTSAATQSECPRDEAIATGDAPFLHARASVNTYTQACPAPKITSLQSHSPLLLKTSPHTQHRNTSTRNPSPQSSSKQLTCRIAARQPLHG